MFNFEFDRKASLFFVFGIVQGVAFIVGASGVGGIEGDQGLSWFTLIFATAIAIAEIVVNVFAENIQYQRILKDFAIVATALACVCAEAYSDEDDSDYRAATCGFVLTCLVQFGIIISFHVLEESEILQ